MATMRWSRPIPATLLVALAYLQYVRSQCDTCLTSSSIACVSANEFRPCYNGVLSGDIISCPTDTTCTDDPAICLPNANSPTAACAPKCQSCEPDWRFACLNETSYAFCFGSPNYSTVIANCPTNLVCSHKDPPNFCVSPTNFTADCQDLTTTAPPTTVVPGTCTEPGRFPLLGSTDCKKYVYCFYNNFVLKNQTYTCQGTTIFYAPMQQCVPAADYPCIT